jgi:hypothetical protein
MPGDPREAAFAALGEAIERAVLRILKERGEVTTEDVEQIAREFRAQGRFDELDRLYADINRNPRPSTGGGSGT